MKKSNAKLNNRNVGDAAHGDPKGITLISLVITIIVLIILAGVAINLSIGDNGLFRKAQQATQEYANEQAKEQTEIAKVSNEIDKNIDGNRTESLKTRFKYLGDYVSTTQWTKVATYDEIKDYSLFVLSVYWDPTTLNIGGSSIFTLEDLMRCKINASGTASIDNYGTAGVFYDETNKEVFVNASSGVAARLLAIQ